jgi:hypothetical protein
MKTRSKLVITIPERCLLVPLAVEAKKIWKITSGIQWLMQGSDMHLTTLGNALDEDLFDK